MTDSSKTDAKPSEMDDRARDEQGFRAATRKTVLESLVPMCTGLTLIFLLFMMSNILRLDQKLVQIEMVCDLLCVLVFVTVLLLARRGRLSPQMVNPLVLGMTILILANVLGTALLMWNPADLFLVPLMPVVSATFLLSWFWFASGLVVVIAAWAPVALLTNPDMADLFNNGMVLLGASLLAVVIHWSRLRTQKELHQALTNAKRELDDRLETELLLRRERDFLERLIGTAPVIVLMLDEDGAVISYNPAMEKVIGVPLTDAEGSVFFDRFSPPSQDRSNDLFSLTMSRHRLEGMIGPILGRQGIRQIEWYSTRLTEASGKLSGALMVGQDVTDRLKERERQAQLEAQLRQAQKMEAVGSLAGGLAHDMNNILGAILGFASLIKESRQNGDFNIDDLTAIIDAARRGSSLTRSLLAFSRKADFRKEPLSLNQTVFDVVQILSRTIDKTIDIDMDLDPDLFEIDGDTHQWNQAVMNLCLNSAQSMDGKGVLRLASRNRDLSPDEAASFPGLRPGPAVELTVTDTGSGIDPAILHRVFEPFFTTKGPGKGTGLGLTMVYSTVKHHDGAISILSSVGVKTTVTIILPAREPDSDPRRISRSARALAIPEHGTVLIIDDEEPLRRLGHRVLEEIGLRVLLAENGLAGIETIRSSNERIDLVLLDMRMPVMDGPECFNQIRKINPSLPVLIATGFAETTDTESLLEQGALGILRKPFSRADLINAVSLALAMDAPVCSVNNG